MTVTFAAWTELSSVRHLCGSSHLGDPCKFLIRRVLESGSPGSCIHIARCFLPPRKPFLSSDPGAGDFPKV